MKRILCIEHFLGKIVVSAVLLVLFSAFSAAGQGKCNIIAGWEPWKPFQYNDEDGNLTGLDIEMMKAVVENMECQITFVERPWNRVLLELQKGKLQLAASASKTAEREEFAYFSEPYREETFVLYVRKGESEAYPLHELTDITTIDFRLGVVRGYYYGEAYAEFSEKPESQQYIREVTYDYLNYDNLLQNKIDGFLSEPYVATSALRKRGLLEQVEIHPVTIHTGAIHFMLSKESVTPEMLQSFNESLADIKARGIHENIMKTYLP